jgi:2,3-dihydroxybenzoate-AMP ligase
MLTGAVPWPAELARRYQREAYWNGETLAGLLRDPARSGPSRTAVVAGGQRISYAELDGRADQLAAGLHALGAAAGDRFVVQLPNTVGLLAVCIALFRLGAIPILALASHRKAEIGYLCEHGEAVGLVIPDVHLGFDYRPMAREVRAALPGLRHVLVVGNPGEFTALADIVRPPADLPSPDPAEVALCLLSGGTTGLPKLIPRTHNDYLCQMRGTAWEMGLDESGAYLAALPVTHNAALGCPGALGALWAGAKVVLAASPAPDEAFPLIAAEDVTLTTLMPTFLPLWAATVDLFGVDLSRLVIEVGGARLDPAVVRSAEQALGCVITRWFGMAEGMLCFTRPGEPARVRHETEGRPLWPSDEIRIVDERERDVPHGGIGELLVRGPSVVRGYFRAPEYNATAFTAAGFLRTGDLARMTPEGNMVVEGRLRDVVNRGGEKVPTAEVEEHVRAHPSVKDVAITALPDAALGERSCAFVIPGEKPPSLRELRDFLAGRGLAAFKLPDQLELIGSFPCTPVGKVDKAALRASRAAS